MNKNKHSTKKLTTEEFINKAKDIHGDKYDYSKVEYVNNKTKVCIICPEHGEFYQTPRDHLNGSGCKKCFDNLKRGKKRQLTTKEFIEKAKLIHGEKYDYSAVKYVNNSSKILIICHEHGEFLQTPNDHLSGCGCKKCSIINKSNKIKSTTDIFIKNANLVHNNKYDYSKVNYINNRTKICIICPEHGEFWQTPHSHLNGRGCPHCNESHMENEIENILNENKIKYILHERKIFKNRLELDFYMPEYKIAIECQGLQHFSPIKYFGGNEDFEKRKKNDELKKFLCEQNGIRLIYYSNIKNFEFPYEIYNDKNEMIKEIEKWIKYTK